MAALLVALAGVGPARARQAAPDSALTRIQLREVVVLREPPAALRVIERIELAPPDRPAEATDPESALALIRLPATVQEIVSLEGDLPADRIVFDAPHVLLMGGAPDSTVRLNVTYRLPERLSRIAFRSELPTVRVVISIARNAGDARPARGLGVDTIAPPPPNFRRFIAEALGPGEPAVLSLVHQAVTWRERVAVLLTTLLAGALAVGWVWRRGRVPA